MRRLVHALFSEDGNTAVEYAVMLCMIILVLLGSVSLLGGHTYGIWTGIQSSLTSSAALH
jgi:Flp pilus assembly pilin Flp